MMLSPSKGALPKVIPPYQKGFSPLREELSQECSPQASQETGTRRDCAVEGP